MMSVRIALYTLVAFLLSASHSQAGLKVGDTVKPFTLMTLQGQNATVGFDKQVNLLVFWVSSCSLCQQELKVINQLVDTYAGKDISFNVVSTDYGGTDVVKYVLKMTKTEPKVPILMDSAATLATKTYGISRFPTALLIGKGGKVLWHLDGWEPNSNELLVSEIDFRLGLR